MPPSDIIYGHCTVSIKEVTKNWLLMVTNRRVPMFAAVFKRQLARNLVKLDNETSCYGLETNDQLGVEDAASTCI